MSARVLLLCPGQGGQHAAMFDLARRHPAGAALLARLAPLLPAAAGATGPVAQTHAAAGTAREPAGEPAALPDTGSAAGSAADWHANRHAQPLVVAATLSMWAALADAAPAPALVAGYSIGELAAWSVAGALDPFDAVALAAQRAALMDQCLTGGIAPAGERPRAMPDRHAMLAFSGLPAAGAAAQAAPHGGWLAIRNGEDSGVIGLPAGQADALHAQLAARGGKVTRLPVTVASHTPCMAGAVTPFADVLAASPWRDASCPVLSGTSAERLFRRAQALAHLPRQLAHTICWDDCMDACAEAGITLALELGPGNALARMMQARHPQIACRSVADFRSVDGIARWLERYG